MRPLVAIVGRPNVGKSTLFNRLVGGRPALVEDVPGVTRDRHYGDGDWNGRALSYVDTGGFVPEAGGGASEPGRAGAPPPPRGGGVGGRLPGLLEDKALLASMRSQAQLAVEEAAAIVLVCDATEGLLAGDLEVGRLLRRSGKPLFVVANKVDSDRREAELPIAELYRLGVQRVYPVSAEHGRGVGELLDDLVAALPDAPSLAEEPPPREDGRIRLAVVGRPNVGKSTLVNALVGEERFIASPVPGTTRDAVDETVDHAGRTFVLTDTAGIRRHRSIAARIESFAVVRALKALDEADVAAVLVDPSELAVDQDARIAGIALEKGRALVLVVNKWDLLDGDEAAQKKAKETLADRLDFASFAPVVFASALHRTRTSRILDTAIRLHDQATRRLSTHDLNEWLHEAQSAQAAPLWRGLPVKMVYATQVGTGPLTIAISANRPEAVTDSYRRYLVNRLRRQFELEVPVRLVFRKKTGARRARGK